ncbi:hypothetical protein EZS27_003902 [termite gut metagenome]|uniref:Uncharacterized protein n=1 Tax=termite gut metagenome TaxID=433724 RepID=A0A5J4SQZ6_9ZZZZ
MKKLLMLFALICAVCTSSCSDKDKDKKDFVYDLTIKGNAVVLKDTIPVDFHFTNADTDHSQGDKFANVLYENEKNLIAGWIEEEIKKVFGWVSYDITINGSLEERITKLEIKIDDWHFVYPKTKSESRE